MREAMVSIGLGLLISGAVLWLSLNYSHNNSSSLKRRSATHRQPGRCVVRILVALHRS